MALSNKEIGARIRNVRRECGLTQDRFAEKFHVTQQTLSRYESGKIAVPNDTLEDIAKETGISVGYFLGVDSVDFSRSEERRVGKDCCLWSFTADPMTDSAERSWRL